MTMVLVMPYFDFDQKLANNYVVMERGTVKAQGLETNMQADGVRQMVAI